MPIEELHAKFYELYGGHEMRNKLIWEGHYDSLVMDDLIAALGAGRGRHLFEFIEYKVDEDNLRRENQTRLAEEEARRQEDRDEYERRRLDDRWDRRVEQGEREARAAKLGDEISGLHRGIAVAEQQGNNTYAAYLRGEIARLEAQSRGL
jgi:hypothetical protein